MEERVFKTRSQSVALSVSACFQSRHHETTRSTHSNTPYQRIGLCANTTAPLKIINMKNPRTTGPIHRGRRAKVAIATKVGLAWKDGKPFRNASRSRVMQEIDDSLRRLKTDVIDLYQVHWPDPNVPLEETAGAMNDLLKAGKIRSIGVSNFSTAQMDKFRAVAPLHTEQPPYNLFEREIERDVLPYARRNKIVTLAYGALCRGLLAGKMTPDTKFSGDDLRRSDPKFRPPRFAQYLKAVAALDQFAQAERSPALQAATLARQVSICR